MPKLISHTAGSCSYERQKLRRHTWPTRRHQLLLGLWLTCSGFTWPGRVPHLSYQAAHGSGLERVEALRVLEEYPDQASRDACLAALEDAASEVRAQAARCVGAAGDERAATSLLDLADAKDPVERAAALEALGRIAPPRALPSIERAFSDPLPGVRTAAVHALTAYVRDGSFEIAKLSPMLSAESAEVRLAAVEVLASVPNVAAASPVQLRAAARDQAAEVRVAALRAMGRAHDVRHLPDLSAASTDADESVRLAAIAALGDSNLAGASAPLRGVTAANPAQLRAARTALAALGRIDDPSALPPIAAALSRLELTQSAASALVARAQRVNQQDTYQQSIAALQRAIEAIPSASRSVGAPSGDKGAVDLSRGANARDAAASAGALATAGRARDSGSAPSVDKGAVVLSPSANAHDAAASTGALATASGVLSLADARVYSAAGEHPADAALDALAGAVLELAPFVDVRGATSSIVQALIGGRGAVDTLTQRVVALMASQSASAAERAGANASHEQLLAALLARDAAASPGLPEALIAVLVASTDAAQLVAAHREQLRRIADAQPTTTPAAFKLHTLLHVAQADAGLDARRALAALWAEQPALAAEREQLDRLVRWLDDADADVREHSSVALGRAADTAGLEALSARLERAAPYPELTLRACAGALLRGHSPDALRERLLQQFQSYLSNSDETVAMSAIFALRAAREPRSAPWIAGLLRGSSPQLRAAAIQSLAGFEQPEARRMLRDMLRGDNVQNASNAALALAELGSDRDVEALLHAAERGSWPLPPAAAYAAARITARGVTRKHSLERVLCRFAQLRDSYVLSNIVSALATLGADACDEHIQPKKLLDPTLPSTLRASAALWLQSTRPHSPEDSAERNALLARCASDHDSAVATACRPSTAAPTLTGHTLLRAYPPDANNALTNRVVALRHPDGTVFVGQTDNTGRSYIPRAAPSELRLEDPADNGALALPASAP